MTAPPAPSEPGRSDDGADVGERRPLVERLGLAAIAGVLAVLFAFVAVASWLGGELFLACMGALGAGVTIWLAARTLFRG